MSRAQGHAPGESIYERFYRLVKDEFFARAFREKLYARVGELQSELDALIEFYNTGHFPNREQPARFLEFLQR